VEHGWQLVVLYFIFPPDQMESINGFVLNFMVQQSLVPEFSLGV
jgi:hypothetical protein